MAETVAQIDERLAADETTQLSADENKFADAALAGLTPEQRAQISALDVLLTVRGYQTYNPRLEETNKALKMIADWRDKVEFYTFLKSRLPVDTEFHQFWPEFVYGEDKYGHVVVGMRFEQIDTDSMEKAIHSHAPQEDHSSESSLMLRLQGQKMACLTHFKDKKSKASGTQRYKHIIVADLSGLGMSILGSHKRGIIKAIMDVGANYFPESIWKIFLINAPFVFRAIWAVVKPWIHPITVAKIHVLGGPKDSLKKMVESGIPESSLPSWVGGSHPGTPIINILQDMIKENNSDEALTKKLESAVDLV
eukprot:m.223590 g.223590  ORF g.223590 m.223590 type:complete len:308 (+) comp10947_c0_seq1:28-951(+)